MPVPWVIKTSRDHRRRLGLYEAAAAAAASYSLSFDATDDVNCGHAATISGLNADANGFTIDAYWQCPALAQLTNYHRFPILCQGDPRPGTDGLFLSVFPQVIPASKLLSISVDARPVAAFGYSAIFTLVEAQWYYIRWRQPAGTGWIKSKLSVDAGAETDSANNSVPGTEAAGDDVLIGQSPIGVNYPGNLRGNLCYLYCWQADKGALASVPTSPFAVDGDTVARYVFSEGSGGSLADDSGNANDGTITDATWSPNIPAGWTS